MQRTLQKYKNHYDSANEFSIAQHVLTCQIHIPPYGGKAVKMLGEPSVQKAKDEPSGS